MACMVCSIPRIPLDHSSSLCIRCQNGNSLPIACNCLVFLLSHSSQQALYRCIQVVQHRGRAAHPTHSLYKSMWEEVIAGKHSLCAMSSSTAKFRTWGMLNMQRKNMLGRRSLQFSSIYGQTQICKLFPLNKTWSATFKKLSFEVLYISCDLGN